MAVALQEIIHLFEATRARELHLTPAGHKLRDMKRLPAHLIDDVNAQGLPLDHRMPLAIDRDSALLSNARPANVTDIRPRFKADGR
jgi:hypothetical protein